MCLGMYQAVFTYTVYMQLQLRDTRIGQVIFICCSLVNKAVTHLSASENKLPEWRQFLHLLPCHVVLSFQLRTYTSIYLNIHNHLITCIYRVILQYIYICIAAIQYVKGHHIRGNFEATRPPIHEAVLKQPGHQYTRQF